MKHNSAELFVLASRLRSSYPPKPRGRKAMRPAARGRNHREIVDLNGRRRKRPSTGMRPSRKGRWRRITWRSHR